MPKMDPATRAAAKSLVATAMGRKGATITALLEGVATSGLSADSRQRAVREIKGRIAVQRFTDHGGRNGDGVLTVRPPGAGEVAIGRVEYGEADDVPYIDVYTAGPTVAGDPHFRIINPPMLVEDPAGAIVRTFTPHGRKPVTRRFREDPLAAIAQVIANQGGVSR